MINNFSPGIASTVITTSTDIVLHFNEDVQKGTAGTLSLCLNSNAEDDGTPKCTAGDLSDDADAEVGYNSVTIDRRKVTIPIAKDLKIGQKLYVLLPDGFVRDTTSSSTNVAAVQTSGYSFTVKDLDTIKTVGNSSIKGHTPVQAKWLQQSTACKALDLRTPPRMPVERVVGPVTEPPSYRCVGERATWARQADAARADGN